VEEKSMAMAQHVEYHPGLRQHAPAEDILAALLAPGEEIAYVASISPAVYWKGFAMALVALVSCLWSLNLAAYFLVIAAILLFLAWSTQRYLLLGATNRRIICRHGILYSDVMSLRYGAIESLDVITSPLGALLGYSDVLITGTGQLRFMVPYVADAMAFREAAMAHMQQ
jgi:hypothetical protein